MSPLFSADFILALRLVPFYIALFLIVGFQLPFWPVWLSHMGLGAGEIGIVLSAPIWAKILITPVMTAIADYFGRRRAPLVLMSALCLGLFQLYFVVDGFWQIFFLALTIGVFITSFTALGDNLVLTLARTRNIDYARIRLWGSISFIAGAYAGGLVMTDRSPDFIPVLLAVAYLLLFLCCVMLPEISVARRHEGAKGFRLLLENRPFMIFLIACGLIQGSHSVLYSAGTLHWQQQGLSDGMIGFLWAEGVVVEVLLFAFSKRLFASFSPVQLMLLGGVAGAIRWVIMGLTPGVPVLLGVQMLHGVTFAAAHLGAMRMIGTAIPVELSARAQGLYTAVSLGLIMGGEMLLSGYLYSAFGGSAYFFMALSCLVAILICLRLRTLQIASID